MNQEKETQPLIFTVLERAVTYARVSGDDRHRDGRNLASQLDMGRKYAQVKGYNLIEELAEDDRGASGYEIDLPQLNKIREMAHAQQFDVLIVREMDRLSRNLAKQLIVEEELRKAGVRIEYVLAEYEDSPEGRLSKHIRATVAEYEREKIRERSMREKRNLARKGHVIVNGKPPYGYKLVKPDKNKDGNGDNRNRLEIIEDEAKIIRLIFQWYVYGDETGKRLTAYEIRAKLSKMKVPTPGENAEVRGKTRKKKKSGDWCRETIRRILKNETYTGIYYYGKQNPKKDWIAIKVPQIIDRELFDATQKILEKNKRESKRNKKSYYMLSHRLKCGFCNRKLIGQGQLGTKYRYYICPARIDPSYAGKCYLPYFRVDAVDTEVWTRLERFFTDPAALEVGIKEYKEGQEEKTRPLEQSLQAADRQIEEYKAKLKDERKILAFLEGSEAHRTINDTLEAIVQTEKTLDSLELERDKIAEMLKKHAMTEQEEQDIRAIADQIKADIETFRQDPEGRRELLNRLNVSVTLTVEDGEKIAYMECRLSKDPIRLLIEDKSTRTIGHNQQTPFIFTARIVLGPVTRHRPKH